MARGKTARARKISKSLKLRHAKARRIWEQEPDLTYRQAVKMTSETFIETVRRAEETYTGRFVEMERPGRYKRIPEGKPALRRYAVGRTMTFDDVERARGVGMYWTLVKRLARQYDLSIPDARAMVREMRDDMEAARRFRRAMGIQGTPWQRDNKAVTARDVVAAVEFSDKYPRIRKRYGI